MKLSLWSAIGLILVASGLLNAAPITINNPSFENPALPCPGSNECYETASVPGWTTVGAALSFAVFKPGPAELNGVPDGVQVLGLGFDSSGEVDQDTLTSVLAANVTYTLQVEVGRRLPDINGAFAFANYSIALVGLKTQSNDVTPTAGNFLLDTLTYTTTAADIGKEVTVQLVTNVALGSEHQADFDMVTLDATSAIGDPVPEPSAFVLAGLGLLPLAILLRRRQTSRA
jgi:hypothetical protein